MILNLEIILYSIIQGLTEFLPVSSSAHLYFLEKFYKWEDIGVIFPLAAHLGTLIAVIVHQKNKIFRIIMIDIIEDSNYILIKIIIISILPTLIIGILLATILSKYYNFSLLVIGISTIIGAMLLEISDRKKCNSINLSDLSYKKSVFIGFFQTLSLIPGMSRSGTVITAMRFLGIDRKTSISFSLLSGIPIIFAACTFSIYNIEAKYKSNKF